MCTTASVYEGAENWPNLYAGAFSVMLLILFVLNKRINWKKKIAPVLFVLFFMASFANSKKVAWHKTVAYWRGSGICIGAYGSKHDVCR